MDTNSSSQTAERALKTTADQVGALAEKVQETVRQTQARLSELQHDLVDRTRYAARSTDEYVHENPWNAVCAAVSIGFILGLIIGRR
jgi:ElaB/YqjD/DUF883 family membrane-anchored ribosome-binding protein